LDVDAGEAGRGSRDDLVNQKHGKKTNANSKQMASREVYGLAA
jgi:hypothetical protein